MCEGVFVCGWFLHARIDGARMRACFRFARCSSAAGWCRTYSASRIPSCKTVSTGREAVLPRCVREGK